MATTVKAGTVKKNKKIKMEMPAPKKIISGYFGYNKTIKPNMLKLYAIFTVSRNFKNRYIAHDTETTKQYAKKNLPSIHLKKVL